MPRSLSSGRSSSFLLTAVAIVLIGCAFWYWGSARGTSIPAHEPEQRPVKALGQDTSSEPAIEAPPAASEEPARTAALDSLATESAKDAPTEFHGLRKLVGRVVPSSPLPADEVMTVTLETYTASDDPDAVEDLASLFGGEKAWRSVATKRVKADGTFEFPRPLEVDFIQLRVEGDYTSGRFYFEVGKERDPGDAAVTIDAFVGAHVTLRLVVQDSDGADALAALEGDQLTFGSSGPSSERDAYSTLTYSCEATLDAGGQAVLRGVEPYDWVADMLDGDTGHQHLDPFLVDPGFHFEPEVGTRLVVDVPIRRGTRFEGVVNGDDGRPIEHALVAIKSEWRRGGSTGTSYRRRRTGPDGRFCFQALGSDTVHLACTALGFLKYELGPDELESMLAAPGPHVIALAAGRSLAIHVTAEGGLAAQGVLVIITSDEDPKVFAQQVTGEDGSASFVGLPPGPLTLRANGKLVLKKQSVGAAHWKFSRIRRNRGAELAAPDPSVETLWSASVALSGDAPMGSTVLPVPLQRNPVISGRVIGADPSWPSPVRIVVDDDAQPNRMPLAYRLSGSSRSVFVLDPATGRFSGQLPRGHYTARAVSSERMFGPPLPGGPQIQSSPGVPFEVADSDVGLVLSFGASKAVSGTVTTADGVPLPGVVVRLAAVEFSRPTIVAAVYTDTAGEFTFAPKGPRLYEVSTSSPRFRGAERYSVEIRADQPVEHLEIKMAAAGAVRVTLLSPGAPAEVVSKVSVTSTEGERVWASSMEDDPEWKGAHGPLLPGTYVVAVIQTLESGQPVTLRRRVEIRAGELTEVTLEAVEAAVATASGTITSGGEALDHISVALTMDGQSIAAGQTNSLGDYTMHLSETGTMTLGGVVPGSPDAFSLEVKLGPGLNTLPTIDLPTGAVEGQFSGRWEMGMVPAVYRSGESLDGIPFRRATSLSNGYFRLPFLPDGDYVVTVFVYGRGAGDPDFQVPVTVSGGKSVRGVELEVP